MHMLQVVKSSYDLLILFTYLYFKFQIFLQFYFSSERSNPLPSSSASTTGKQIGKYSTTAPAKINPSFSNATETKVSKNHQKIYQFQQHKIEICRHNENKIIKTQWTRDRSYSAENIFTYIFQMNFDILDRKEFRKVNY